MPLLKAASMRYQDLELSLTGPEADGRHRVREMGNNSRAEKNDPPLITIIYLSYLPVRVFDCLIV